VIRSEAVVGVKFSNCSNHKNHRSEELLRSRVAVYVQDYMQATAAFGSFGSVLVHLSGGK
jgi:hypothetical protein